MSRHAVPGGQRVPDKVVDALDRITRGVRAHRQATATNAAITPLQADLVRTLADGPPPPALTGLLAAELGVSQPTVSDSLVALERKAFVLRSQTPGDQRRSTFTLTKSGEELAADLNRADDILRTAVSDLADYDQEIALRVLLALITGLLRSGALAVARTCPTCRFYDEAGAAPRCSLLQVTLAPADLQVDCAEHQA